MIRPDTSEEMNSPRISGVVLNPAWVGLSPRLIWKYWLRKTVAPNSAIPTKRLATTAREMLRCLNKPSGMTGSAARDSTRTASAPITMAPSTMAIVCQDHQSKLLPANDTQISSNDTAPVISVAPSQSILTSSRLTVGRCSVFCSSTMAIAANGTPT